MDSNSRNGSISPANRDIVIRAVQFCFADYPIDAGV